MTKGNRNFKRKIAAVALCGTLAVSMLACGAASSEKNGGNSWANSDGMVVTESMDASYGWYSDEKDVLYKSEAPMQSAPTQNGTGTVEAGTVTTQRKTIKTARLTLQTLDFDQFAVALDAKLLETGSYLQYADVGGKDYYGGRRYATYTVRVPAERLNEFLSGMEGIATVTNKTLGETDVTLSYVDTESRVKSLKIEQERLFALLEKADTLDAIIQLESRLSEVRYEIENYEAQLRTYDDKIAYSTVTMSVSEVKKVTEPEPETVWDRIARGWENTIYDVTVSVQDFFVWFVINIPYLVFWGAVIVAAVVWIKKKNRKRQQKKLEKQREQNGTDMGSEE